MFLIIHYVHSAFLSREENSECMAMIILDESTKVLRQSPRTVHRGTRTCTAYVVPGDY